jgi:hypothetical protein
MLLADKVLRAAYSPLKTSLSKRQQRSARSQLTLAFGPQNFFACWKSLLVFPEGVQKAASHHTTIYTTSECWQRCLPSY